MPTTYILTIGPDDIEPKGIAWRARRRVYIYSTALGQIEDYDDETSGGRPCRTAPTTREGWLAYCRRHGGEIRPGSWSRLRWAEATITAAGADYRNGARLVWEV